MIFFNKYANLIPYFYFVSLIVYWFTYVNRSEGLTAYPILLLAIPFLWQIVRPNRKLNFSLGITFICLSSYLIFAYLSNLFNIPSIVLAKGIILYGGLLVLLNFVMSAWIVRNSIKRTF